MPRHLLLDLFEVVRPHDVEQLLLYAELLIAGLVVLRSNEQLRLTGDGSTCAEIAVGGETLIGADTICGELAHLVGVASCLTTLQRTVDGSNEDIA